VADGGLERFGMAADSKGVDVGLELVSEIARREVP